MTNSVRQGSVLGPLHISDSDENVGGLTVKSDERKRYEVLNNEVVDSQRK